MDSENHQSPVCAVPFVIGLLAQPQFKLTDASILQNRLDALLESWLVQLNPSLKHDLNPEQSESIVNKRAFTPLRILFSGSGAADQSLVDASIMVRERLIKTKATPTNCIQLQLVSDQIPPQLSVQLNTSRGDFFSQLGGSRTSQAEPAQSSTLLTQSFLISNASHLLLWVTEESSFEQSLQATWHDGVELAIRAKLGDIESLNTAAALVPDQELIPSWLNNGELGLVCHLTTDLGGEQSWPEQFVILEPGLELTQGISEDEKITVPNHGVYYQNFGKRCDGEHERHELGRLLFELLEVNRQLASTSIKNNENCPFADEVHIAADDAARKFQSSYRNKVLLVFFALSTLGYIFYEVQSATGQWQPMALLLLVLIAIGLLLWKPSDFTTGNTGNRISWLGKSVSMLDQILGITRQPQSFKSQFQTMRGLAEILRVKGVLNEAGIGCSDNLLPRSKRKDFPVHYQLLRLVDIDAWCASQNDSRREVIDTWLEGQTDFFKSRLRLEPEKSAEPATSQSEPKHFKTVIVWLAARTDYSKTARIALGVMNRIEVVAQRCDTALYKRPKWLSARVETLSQYCFFVAIGLGISTLLLAWLPSKDATEWAALRTWLSYGIPAAMLLSALMKEWLARNGTDAMVDNYEDMHALMRQAQQVLKGRTGPWSRQERKMIKEVARSALLEHLLWTDVQRKNEIK